MENEILQIKLDDIIPNRFQPREIFDEEALEKLADSIRQHGVIEPIIVRPVSNKFEIVAGERRYKASVLAGLTKIPAIVKQLDDKESSIIAYIENEHRSDVSAIEEAKSIERILKMNNMTQEELAKEIGINQSTIANKIRLLNLPIEVQDALMHNEISERHARSLLSIKDEKTQIDLLNKIKERKMTVKELEKEIKSMNNGNNYNEYMNSNINNEFMQKPQNEMPNMNQEINSPQNNDFMDYLNNYDNINPLPQTPSMPSNSSPSNDDFMNYLNNYSNNAMSEMPENNPVIQEPTNQTSGNDDFMNYLNTFSNNEMPQETQFSTPNIDTLNSNVSNLNDSNNIMYNNVTPPITNNFETNQYIEGNPNYVDVSKLNKIDSIDDVIEKIKNVLDDIKQNSNIKIDTDEINYDDLYQITIKVDKRDY